MSATIREELTGHFPSMLDDEKLLSECISICQNYNISGTDFYFKSEALRFGRGNQNAATQLFTLVEADELKKSLLEDLNRKRMKEQAQNAKKKREDALNIMMRRNQSGSKNIKLAASGKPSGLGAKPAAPRVSFKRPSEDKTKRNYRYMYEKMSERSEVLDERIDEFGELIREHYDIDELGDPSAASEEDIVVVGRICGDADADASTSSKLSEGSIFLESSRMSGSGARVPLRFAPDVKLKRTAKGAGSVGFFPGAIVALRGKNGGGGLFVVEEILGLPPLAPSTESSDHKAFSMAVICGPYTADADLEYKHFASLLENLALSKPIVVLLLGPFLDASHPLIKCGDVEETPINMFSSCIIEQLRSFLSICPDSLILLQPSIRDVLSSHHVYPQCEFENNFTSDPRIKMLPNPCRFSLNDVTFASTSVDVIFHLRSQEYMQRGQEIDPVTSLSPNHSSTDLLTNTCRHLLLQRSFYPLFPVPADLSAEVNLDVSHSDGLRLDESTPDVLVLPSRLKHFSKMVDSTLAVNPSYLTKGTFAMISVPDSSRTEIHGNIKCEIVKM